MVKYSKLISNMESGDHFKNGGSLKSYTSRANYSSVLPNLQFRRYKYEHL